MRGALQPRMLRRGTVEIQSDWRGYPPRESADPAGGAELPHHELPADDPRLPRVFVILGESDQRTAGVSQCGDRLIGQHRVRVRGIGQVGDLADQVSPRGGHRDSARYLERRACCRDGVDHGRLINEAGRGLTDFTSAQIPVQHALGLCGAHHATGKWIVQDTPSPTQLFPETCPRAWHHSHTLRFCNASRAVRATDGRRADYITRHNLARGRVGQSSVREVAPWV